MKSEDLFAAIGEIDSVVLAQSELMFQKSSKRKKTEEDSMKHHTPHYLSKLLIAAIIITVLSVTAFAASGYLLFDSPKEMVKNLFGNQTGYDSGETTKVYDPENPDSEGFIKPGFNRVPADDTIAEEISQYVDFVGQSVSYGNYTLTVDANMYDSSSKCGFLTYTIENPNGLAHYEVEENGEVWFPIGELLSSNQYGKSYIIKNKCTSTKLAATYYYQTRNQKNDNLELRLSFWALAEDSENFENLYDEDMQSYQNSENVIIVSAQDSKNIQTVKDVKNIVTVSPIALTVHLSSDTYLNNLSVTMDDGSQYIIITDNTANYIFATGDSKGDGGKIYVCLNRLIDVAHIQSVTVNGTELPIK